MEKLTKVARVAQVIMGLVWLISGLIKIWEPVLFYWEVIPYTQLLGLKEGWQLVSRLTILVAPFECALGFALLTNWRPRLVFPLSVVLMVFFLGLMVSAWKIGATEDCGCFGSLVDRSPGEAAVEDAFMLLLLLIGWWRMRGQPAIRGAGKWVAVGTFCALFVTGARFFPEAGRLEGSDLQPGVRLTGLNPRGLEVDLMKGEYLLELMSPRCGRCMESVAKLNELIDEGGLPPIVALNSFPQDGEALKQFKERLLPKYPIGTVSKTDFFRLTWKHGYPRLAYLRNGAVQKVWEYFEFPDAAQLKEALEQH